MLAHQVDEQRPAVLSPVEPRGFSGRGREGHVLPPSADQSLAGLEGGQICEPVPGRLHACSHRAMASSELATAGQSAPDCSIHAPFVTSRRPSGRVQVTFR